MPISIPILLSYLLLIGSARAQVNAPNCTDYYLHLVVQFAPTKSLLGHGVLGGRCATTAVFSIPALEPQHYYTGPSGVDNDDLCKCNTVLYNLISACDACQGQSWLPYSLWSFNCTTKVTPGNFSKQIPAITRVPHWAYNISGDGGDWNWNISVAQLAGREPEVTGTASTSTSTVAQSTSTSNHSSNTGAIAGGVVGGVIGAALIAGVIVWFSIRRRRARSSPYLDFQGGEMEQPPPHPLKIYDPSDPSTYPSKEYLPRANQLGSTYLQPSDGGYSGLPEI
ncbi:hypothetical protein EDB85DRAFT_863282 [Lactarius pseudohatsudake]|nr:hypothetical protein EDB85DRAFT_863282 [Lactarius pseudohatsudake]